ncbi:hypothetical protein GCM10023345_21720 [Acinetobacter kookii]
MAVPVTARAERSAEAMANFFMDTTPQISVKNNTFFVTTFSLDQNKNRSIH